MADPPRQPTIPTEPAWVRLCRWLWNQRGFLWGTVIIGIALNLIASWLTTPLGTAFSQTPLGSLLGHPLPFALGGVGLLGLTAGLWLINRHHPAPASLETWPHPQAVPPTRKERQPLLERLHGLYQEAVEQSLRGMRPMDLGLERTFEATSHPALSVVSYRPAGVREAIAPGTPILDVYREAGDGLLILGNPGAGKSTLLCNLALALTERAEHDATQRPPVLVPLTSWAEKRLPLEQWLAEELHTKYQISRTLAPRWLMDDHLLPLLDGLDEVTEEARSACIEAINTYRQEHPLPIVVSSRSAEYQYLSQERKLHLQSAIEVQPLTHQQVDGYLKREGKPLAVVQAALQEGDADLRALVTTPLMLSVVMEAYRGKPAKDLPHLRTVEEWRHKMFEDYITRVLEPTWKPTRKWRYTSDSDSTQKRLTWLAQQMRQRSPEFYLERLQPDWLPERQGIFYQWSVGLVGGLVLGLYFGVLSGLISGLAVGLLFGLSSTQLTKRISPNEGIRRSVKNGLLILFFGLVGGLLYGLLYGLLNGLGAAALQPHFLITAIERKLCSLISPCFEYMIEMSRLLIGNVSMGPNHVFSMACRIRAWSGH